MRNLLVGLFWLWVAMSLAVYGYRVYRRVTRGPKAAREPAEPAGQPTSSTSSSLPPISTLAEAPPATSVPADRGPEPSPTGTTTRSGMFASGPAPGAAPVAADMARVTEARPTVAELLEGITMPCELSPIVAADRPMDPYRVAFSTSTEPAETVGAAVGDELERLGFALSSTATNRLAATKDGAELFVALHSDPASVVVGDVKSYPTIPPDSVVVEFHV